MPTTAPTCYSTRQVCDLAGITYRMLDYWCRIGLVRPSLADASGSGSRRGFSAHDVAICKVVAAVSGRVALVTIDGLVGFLTDLPLQQWAATSIVLDMTGEVWREGDDAPKVGLHVDLSLVFDERAA